MNGDANVLPFLGSLRPTTWINGQRSTRLDPEADPSGESQQVLQKACAAWVVNNGCIKEFIKSLHESGYLMVLVQPDASP